MRAADACVAFLRRSHRLRLVARLVAGSEAYLTGGSLRDVFLGCSLGELDLAVKGDAWALAQHLAQATGGVAFPLGKPPLTSFRVVAAHLKVDLWPLSGRVEEDAWRRDFTVNALFFRLPQGPLLDPLGGLAHLASGTLEVVRAENLFQDPLRVLRGLRLALTRPLTLTPRAKGLLQEAAPALAGVAKERLREELSKLLPTVPLLEVYRLGKELGIWQALKVLPDRRLPEVALPGQRLESLRRRGHWREAATELAWAALALPRLLAGEAPAAALTQVLSALGWAGKSLHRLVQAVSLGEQLGAETHPKRLLANESPNPTPLAWWYVRSQVSWEEVARLWRWWCVFSRRPPLLPSQEIWRLLSLPPGPARGAVIRRLRQLQAEGVLRTPAAARRQLAAQGVARPTS